ncbi:hypothetical protein FOI42_RS03190 [Escherichia coli]|nr:hypothetical protein [Escherichia coli]
MKIITQTQAFGRILKYLDDMIDIHSDLPKTVIDAKRAEYRMMAVLDTNFQEEYVNDWIGFLIEDIKSKL